MSRQHLILVILIAYMLVSLVLGIWSSKRSQKAEASKGFLKNYFIGGRSMGGLVLAMTLDAAAGLVQREEPRRSRRALLRL